MWQRIASGVPNISFTRVAKPWRTGSAVVKEREKNGSHTGAYMIHAEQLIPDDVMASARQLVMETDEGGRTKPQFDHDNDSVDGSPTFEVAWVADGKYQHPGLERVFRESIEETLLPMIQNNLELHGLTDGSGLVLCEALLRMYAEGERQVLPAHYDTGGDHLL